MWNIETPAITFMLRGLVYIVATLHGPSHDLQSGMYGADAVARVVRGEASEVAAWRGYLRALRKRFTVGFAAGYLLRDMVSNGMLDGLARTYNRASFQRGIHWLVGAAMTGTTTQEAPAAYAAARSESGEPSRTESPMG